MHWTADDAFLVEVDHGFTVRWEVHLEAPVSVRAMNLMADHLPGWLWHDETVLRAVGVMATRLLGAGKMVLSGQAPSGQHFVANPRFAWTIPVSHARIEGTDIGEVGPLPVQEHLGDFWIPQRGLFMVGEAFFEPLDPTRHLHRAHVHLLDDLPAEEIGMERERGGSVGGHELVPAELPLLRDARQVGLLDGARSASREGNCSPSDSSAPSNSSNR